MSASQATPKLASVPASTLTARIAAEFAAAGFATAGPAGGGLANAGSSADPRRQRAVAFLAELGLPTSRDENWKYANLRPLEKVRFVPPSAEARPVITQADLPIAIGKSRYVFVDGVFEASLSSPNTLPGVTVITAKAAPGANGAHGVTLTSASAAPARATADGTSDVAIPGDLRFALLNQAFATDGAQIQVARAPIARPALSWCL